MKKNSSAHVPVKVGDAKKLKKNQKKIAYRSKLRKVQFSQLMGPINLGGVWSIVRSSTPTA